MRKFGQVGAVLAVSAASLGFAGVASAQSAVDVTAVVADISAQITPVNAIGGGVLLLVVAIMAFKWVRRAI